MASSSSRRAHSTPIPVGPSILWALKARKSQPEWPHVGGEVGDRLGAVGQHQGPGAVGGLGDAGEGRDGAEDVRHGRAGHELHPVEEAVEVGEVEAVVVVDGDPAQLDAALLGQHEPGHEVGVVLHVGEQDGVARGQVGAGPRWRRPG